MSITKRTTITLYGKDNDEMNGMNISANIAIEGSISLMTNKVFLIVLLSVSSENLYILINKPTIALNKYPKIIHVGSYSSAVMINTIPSNRLTDVKRKRTRASPNALIKFL